MSVGFFLIYFEELEKNPNISHQILNFTLCQRS